jgi:hypothetical protein
VDRGGERQGSGRAVGRRREEARSWAAAVFFYFLRSAISPGDKPAVMAITITVDLNPTALKAGGDVLLEPAVIGVDVVVLAKC